MPYSVEVQYIVERAPYMVEHYSTSEHMCKLLCTHFHSFTSSTLRRRGSYAHRRNVMSRAVSVFKSSGRTRELFRLVDRTHPLVRVVSSVIVYLVLTMYLSICHHFISSSYEHARNRWYLRCWQIAIYVRGVRTNYKSLNSTLSYVIFGKYIREYSANDTRVQYVYIQISKA